jgi:hypothetical protein
MAEEVQELIKIRKAAGFEGSELANFLRDERARQREERQLERQAQEEEKKHQHKFEIAKLQIELAAVKGEKGS